MGLAVEGPGKQAVGVEVAATVETVACWVGVDSCLPQVAAATAGIAVEGQMTQAVQLAVWMAQVSVCP